MRKKKTAKMVGTKLAPNIHEESVDSLNVEINGYLYSSFGTTRTEGLIEAVDAHIGQDREFKDDITIIQKGLVNEIVYAPAVLCMLGYIGRGDLYSLLVQDFLEEDTDELT